jgi:hypothetical protein
LTVDLSNRGQWEVKRAEPQNEKDSGRSGGWRSGDERENQGWKERG